MAIFAFLAGRDGHKIKTKKIAAPLFKKSVSRVSLPKIKVLVQVLKETPIFSQMKIAYISKCMEIPIYYAIRQVGKILWFSVERNILLL